MDGHETRTTEALTEEWPFGFPPDFLQGGMTSANRPGTGNNRPSWVMGGKPMLAFSTSFLTNLHNFLQEGRPCFVQPLVWVSYSLLSL